MEFIYAMSHIQIFICEYVATYVCISTFELILFFFFFTPSVDVDVKMQITARYSTDWAVPMPF